MREIFNLSNTTLKLQATILNIMPFFRIPAHALRDDMIPDICFKDNDRGIFNLQRESLLTFRELVSRLIEKYKEWMSSQRSTRNLLF
jgi:hypothetical protein